MKVGLLTMFNGLDRTYSLVNVVAEQLAMLLSAGIPTKLLVSQDCPDSERTGIFADTGIEWVKVNNRFNNRQINWYDYSQPGGEVHSTFFQEAEAIAEDLVDKLSDVKYCLMHDIHYQGWHLVHNIALRIAQKKLAHIRFLAFTHSAPVNPPANPEWPFAARYTPMPKTIYIYPTLAGIPALARQYNVPEGLCRVVNNSLDLLTSFSEDVIKVHRHLDILSPDILIVYPGRLTPAKRFEKVAALAGTLKRKNDLTVKVVFCDFPSMDIKPELYKKKIEQTGTIFGLEEEDICFTSNLGYTYGFPRKAVLDLFTLSNLFICPSFSESFGLTVLEAASRGNILIINQSVPALEELGKMLKAYYMRWDARNFGFDTKEHYHPSEQAYLEEHAEKITNMLRENQVIHSKTKVRQRYSPPWVWKNQLEPLLNNF